LFNIAGVGGMAKNKIKAYSANVLDYPTNMSMWEKESLAAEAKLAAEIKSNKKSATQKTHFRGKVQRPRIPSSKPQSDR
jgi:hypothetical protein